jgi:hypothetical protein
MWICPVCEDVWDEEPDGHWCELGARDTAEQDDVG